MKVSRTVFLLVLCALLSAVATARAPLHPQQGGIRLALSTSTDKEAPRGLGETCDPAGVPACEEGLFCRLSESGSEERYRCVGPVYVDSTGDRCTWSPEDEQGTGEYRCREWLACECVETAPSQTEGATAGPGGCVTAECRLKPGRCETWLDCPPDPDDPSCVWTCSEDHYCEVYQPDDEPNCEE